MIAAVLVRFAYLAVSHAFAGLWLLRMTDREKDIEILALRHQLAVLQRQRGGQRPRLRPEDRASLAAFLASLDRAALRRFRLNLQEPDGRRWCGPASAEWNVHRRDREVGGLLRVVAARRSSEFQ